MTAGLKEYLTEEGHSPYANWFNGLNARAAARVTAATLRMAQGNFGDRKSVGGGVFERRIDFEKGYRIYYSKDGDEIILLLLGGSKTRQRNDIEKAKAFLADYKKRKKQASKKVRKSKKRR